jgi:hypothetical protein
VINSILTSYFQYSTNPPAASKLAQDTGRQINKSTNQRINKSTTTCQLLLFTVT